MEMFRISLEPQAPIREMPASDTLFGAICWGIRQIYGENKLTDILDNFSEHENRFILSSAFPFISKNGQRLHFYPMPILSEPNSDQVLELAKKHEGKFKKGNKYSLLKVIQELKTFKKVEFISERLFDEIIKGKKGFKVLFEDYFTKKKFSKEGEKFCPENLGGEIKLINRCLMSSVEYNNFLRKEKRPNFLKSEVIQRNKIDRFNMSTTGAGELYYTQEVFLTQYVKLYFIIKTEDIDFFIPIFRWLSDTGIGGDRTSGRGQYKIIYQKESIDLPTSGNPNAFVILSRYLPKPEEVDFNKKPLFYELLPYRSKVESSVFKDVDIWKNRVIYFKEGSLFPLSEEREFYGQLPIIKKFQNRMIRQSGFALPVFARIGGNQ